MRQVDDRILEFLGQYGPATPQEIHFGLRSLGREVGVSPAEAVTRCRLLDSYRLLEYEGEHTFSLSDIGEAYLDGTLDCASLDQWYEYDPETDLGETRPSSGVPD